MLQHIEGQKLIFRDSSSKDVDSILFCTGYQTSFPFFQKNILEILSYKPQNRFQPILLHKTVFHPRLPNMAFVGLYRGAFFGTLELQARWASMAFANKIPYPSVEEMEKGISEELKIRKMNPQPQFPHSDYVAFSDDLAKEIGILPDFRQIELFNPILYNQLWNGLFTTSSYRLSGFGSNENMALEHIKKINESAATHYSKNESLSGFWL